MQKFNLGDIVLFKTGSPPMTVVGYVPTREPHATGPTARAGKYELVWFADGASNATEVSEDALIAAGEFKTHMQHMALVGIDVFNYKK